jgi:radical SAM protein with 4Fe4S-binding SPASM domain
MFSITNVFCDHDTGNERLRYGHKPPARDGSSRDRDDAPRPVVVWAVTRACNLRCVHCYASATPDAAPNELTHAEGLDLLDQLAAFRVPAVLFSGGEPLARPDTLDLIAHARSRGLAVTLSTNGTLLDDPAAARLAELGVKYVGLSIDGCPATHNKLRGADDAFDRTLAGLRTAQRHGLKTGVRFTVHKLNVDQLDDILDLCHRERVDRLCVYHLAYAGRANHRLSLTADQTRTTVDHLIDRTVAAHADAARVGGHKLEVLTVGNHADAAHALLRLGRTDPDRAERVHQRLRRNGGNRSGQNICAIDPTGGVHIDQFSWHHDVGNVRHHTFREIWGECLDPRLKALRERPDNLPEACRRCRFLDVCNGNNRTRAESATGDWLGQDPACYLTPADRARPAARELAHV